MTPLSVSVIGVSAILIYAGIKDVNPIQLVKDALSGKVTPPGSWGGNEPLDPEKVAEMQEKYKHPPGTKTGGHQAGSPPSTNRADYYDDPYDTSPNNPEEPDARDAYKDRYRVPDVDSYQNPAGHYLP